MRIIRSTVNTQVLNFIKTRWIGISVAILMAITVFSLWPLDNLPPAPGDDKFHHVIAYMLLTIPAALRKARRWVLLCIAFIVYSGIIELVQPLVNRYCDLNDLLANAGGVVCGVIVAGLVNIFIKSMSDIGRI